MSRTLQLKNNPYLGDPSLAVYDITLKCDEYNLIIGCTCTYKRLNLKDPFSPQEETSSVSILTSDSMSILHNFQLLPPNTFAVLSIAVLWGLFYDKIKDWCEKQIAVFF